MPCVIATIPQCPLSLPIKAEMYQITELAQYGTTSLLQESVDGSAEDEGPVRDLMVQCVI